METKDWCNHPSLKFNSEAETWECEYCHIEFKMASQSDNKDRSNLLRLITFPRNQEYAEWE